jgi:hypothetical protein
MPAVTRAAEPIWISDRDDPVTDVRRLVGKLNVNKIVPSIDLEKRKIARPVGSHHPCLVGFSVIEPDLDDGASLYHVVVGDCVAVGRNEEAGAQRRS